MTVTYIHHSGFLVESRKFYYLFDYESGNLPELNPEKPIFVLSSHSHGDHYNPAIFSRLPGMQVRAVLSGDISAPQGIDTLSVDPNREYSLGPGQRLTTFRSTDLGVAFLLEEEDGLLYHAGDLHDWVWEGEPEDWNRDMTAAYRKEIDLLAQTLEGRTLDMAFVVLDPRQEADYARGMAYFLDHIQAKAVYPMHYWDDPSIIETFLREYPQYTQFIAHCAERGHQ